MRVSRVLYPVGALSVTGALPGAQVGPAETSILQFSHSRWPSSNVYGAVKELTRRVIVSNNTAARSSLEVALENHFAHTDLYVYVVKNDAGGPPAMLQPTGQWQDLHTSTGAMPEAIPSTASLVSLKSGRNTSLTIPLPIQAGRIYFAEADLIFAALSGVSGGTNAADEHRSSYVELTLAGEELYADVSYVDFVSMPLSLSIERAGVEVASVGGINTSAILSICNHLNEWAQQEGQPWNELCHFTPEGKLVRIMSPVKHIANSPKAFDNYFEPYLDQVYARFNTTTKLVFDGQRHADDRISCVVQGDSLRCEGANRAFAPPSTAEIFGCDGKLTTRITDNGVVAVVLPRFCAAIQRATLLLLGGSLQPSLSTAAYYQSTPSNRYAQLVHAMARDGRGYAFAYDDVNPSSMTDQSGTLHGHNITTLRVLVGDADA